MLAQRAAHNGRTAKKHPRNMLTKLNAHNAAELARIALERGLVVDEN